MNVGQAVKLLQEECNCNLFWRSYFPKGSFGAPAPLFGPFPLERLDDTLKCDIGNACIRIALQSVAQPPHIVVKKLHGKTGTNHFHWDHSSELLPFNYVLLRKGSVIWY